MADRLEDLLRACTVRVLGGPAPGAGFFVAPGHVLTCAHVTGGGGTGSPDGPAQGSSGQVGRAREGTAQGDFGPLVVRWERDGHDPAEIPVTEPVVVLPSRGRPIPALAADYPDIALLRVSGLGAHPCVLLDEDWPEPEDGFQVFGYPSEGGAVVLTPARPTYRGPHGTVPAVFFDLGSDTIKPGMSGAALLSLRTGAVCGVVTATKHSERPDGALAVPWAQIAADLADIAAANRAFHHTDRRWGQARQLTASRPPLPVPPPGDGAAVTGTSAHTEVVIEATLANGTLESATWLAGSQVCRRNAPLPVEVANVWSASAQPDLLAGERLAVAGRRLTAALLDNDTERLLAGLITRLRPGDSAEVTFSLGGEALSLPAELLRLSAGSGAGTGPLALLPAVSVCRRTRASTSLDDRPAQGAGPPTGTAGPLKILAAVAPSIRPAWGARRAGRGPGRRPTRNARRRAGRGAGRPGQPGH